MPQSLSIPAERKRLVEIGQRLPGCRIQSVSATEETVSVEVAFEEGGHGAFTYPWRREDTT